MRVHAEIMQRSFAFNHAGKKEKDLQHGDHRDTHENERESIDVPHIRHAVWIGPKRPVLEFDSSVLDHLVDP